MEWVDRFLSRFGVCIHNFVHHGYDDKYVMFRAARTTPKPGFETFSRDTVRVDQCTKCRKRRYKDRTFQECYEAKKAHADWDQKNPRGQEWSGRADHNGIPAWGARPTNH